MKADERQLLCELQQRSKSGWVDMQKLLADLHMNHKRACYIFIKWAKKDWYEWGGHPIGGWLTEKGKEEEQGKWVNYHCPHSLP